MADAIRLSERKSGEREALRASTSRQSRRQSHASHRGRGASGSPLGNSGSLRRSQCGRRMPLSGERQVLRKRSAALRASTTGGGTPTLLSSVGKQGLQYWLRNALAPGLQQWLVLGFPQRASGVGD
ncbi:MAG: hypothetical protein ACREPR_19855 [Brasilonema sp.]